MSRAWTIAILVAAVLLGAAIGLGGFTFVYARGGSYLGSDPAACANCHVMNDQFNAWQKSSHHAVAGCNDCHAPPGGIGKYWVKAVNGWNHSVAFTSGNFHEPIRITPRNRAVTEAQCRHCHQATVAMIAGHSPEMSCIRCHSQVGHRTSE
jgi:cytochrome c nitrite reductase small subunit